MASMKNTRRQAPRTATTTVRHVEPRIPISHFKARLSQHVHSVRLGGPLTITYRGRPVARVVPFTIRVGGLVVRPATKTWAEVAPLIAKLRPLKLKTDPVELLLEMRKDRV